MDVSGLSAVCSRCPRKLLEIADQIHLIKRISTGKLCSFVYHIARSRVSSQFSLSIHLDLLYSLTHHPPYDQVMNGSYHSSHKKGIHMHHMPNGNGHLMATAC